MSKYQIRLRTSVAREVALVRSLRLIGNLKLKQAHELATHVKRFSNSVVVAGIDESVASHLAAALRDAGAEVIVEPCSLSTPMVCTPTANAKFSWRGWGPFRLIAKSM
jgi:hypothetical protein